MSTLPERAATAREARSREAPPERGPSELAPILRRLERVPRWAGIALVLVVGAVVHSQSIGTGLMLDDYLHSSMIRGTFPTPRHPLDLYNFVDDSDRSVLLERGLIPWWSHPQLTLRFFRPLSSALLWADHLLLGEGALAPHLHSYLWWALAVLAAHFLFARSLPKRAAWIATFAYALAPCHAMPLAWIANREALVSLAFGTTALGLHVKWRDEGNARHALLATLAFSLALFAGEYGISMGGYVLALALVRPAPLSTRVVSVLPFAVPASIYLGVRAYLGYGTAGSGYYLDPLRDPVPFLWMAPRRLAMLLSEGWLSLDPDTLTWSIPTSAMLLGALLLGALVVATLRASIAHLDEKTRSTARFFALGSCFALTPVLAVVPGPRLIGASVIGVAAAAALILDAIWFPSPKSDAPAPRRRAELFALVALALGFAQLVHGPATSWLQGRHFHDSSIRFARQAASLRAHAGEPSTADLVIVRGMATTPFTPFAMYESGELPARVRMLSQSGHVLMLRRGPRTFDLVVAHERGVFPAGEANLYLAGREIHVGDVFETPGLHVTVLEVEAGLPRIARYELDEDFDSPSLIWLNETGKAFFPAVLPEEGFGQPFDHGR